MYNFYKIPMKPMLFKNMSSSFLHYIWHSIGHTGIYQVEAFVVKSMVKKKPVIDFSKTIPQGVLSWSWTSMKIRYCDCRMFLHSSPLVEAHGGPDAKAGAFQNPSKLVRAHRLGEGPTLSRSGKRFFAGNQFNDRTRLHYVFLCRAIIFPANVPEAGLPSKSYFFGMPRGP
jgi:hypothetical protein